MRRSETFWYFVLIFCSVSFSSVCLSENSREYSRLGEKIRHGDTTAGSEYSMSAKTGRFHKIHADDLLLDCSQCHGNSQYKKNFLSVSKFKSVSPANDEGRIEKTSCLGCHQSGGMGTPWYTGSTTE